MRTKESRIAAVAPITAAPLETEAVAAQNPPIRSFTVASVAPGLITPSGPEFCEVQDGPRLWGLRKTMIYRGIQEGWFKSVLVRMPGNKSGKRLLHCQSVRDWLTRQMEAQQGEGLK